MADQKIYLPKQRVTRGVPGYKGKGIVIVDPDTKKETPAVIGTGKKK